MELLQWVESHPGTPLDQGPKLPRNIRGSRLHTLEEALARGAGTTPAEWPERRIHEHHDARSADDKKRIEALRRECARMAGELKIAAWTLAPRATLEAIARNRPRTLDEIMVSGGLLRWQAELVQTAVEKTLHAAREQ